MVWLTCYLFNIYLFLFFKEVLSMNNTINVVIGSWGSYNECNEKALGSKWLDLSEFESYQEVLEELENQGFELNGIDEELFIQDIEGINACPNWDYVNVERLISAIYDSDILNDNNGYLMAQAYMDIESLDSWLELVERHGYKWWYDMEFYQDQSLEDVAYTIYEETVCTYAATRDNRYLVDFLQRYFDVEAFARDLSFEGYHETEFGVIKIN